MKNRKHAIKKLHKWLRHAEVAYLDLLAEPSGIGDLLRRARAELTLATSATYNRDQHYRNAWRDYLRVCQVDQYSWHSWAIAGKQENLRIGKMYTWKHPRKANASTPYDNDPPFPLLTRP